MPLTIIQEKNAVKDNHVTHHDDCGCKSKKYEERIKELEEENARLKEKNKELEAERQRMVNKISALMS